MYQSDIARYLVVDTFGGLYLDTDITCFKCADEMLGTADVVLQASHNHEGLTNFALASVPAAGIWSTVLKIAQQRIAEDKQKNNPIDHTGPRALARAFEKVTGIWAWEHHRHGKHTVEMLDYQVWPLGTWFSECYLCCKPDQKR